MNEKSTRAKKVIKKKIDIKDIEFNVEVKDLDIDYSSSSNLDHMDSFKDNIVNNSNKPISTGFKELDKNLGGGLYQGIYILASIPSLGKTTFAQQIANNMAKNGQHVLSFTLEMGKNELLAKDFSREMTLLAHNSNIRDFNITGLQVEQGIFPQNLFNATELKMQNQLKYLTYIENSSNPDVGTIRYKIRDYISEFGRTVIIIDYLQIIEPYESGIDIREAIDYNMSHLKMISREFNIPIVILSSLNRYNYMNSFGFESIKESGFIEYTADVILGMELYGIEDLDSKKSVNEKRLILEGLKNEEPRKIEIKCIKNRKGSSSFTTRYLYYTKFNFFEECND